MTKKLVAVAVVLMGLLGGMASAAPQSATMLATTESLNPTGTWMVTATIQWQPVPGVDGVMICENNLNSGGGGCIGVEPTLATYTTLPDFVGEINTGTTLTYTVITCVSGACTRSNELTVQVPAPAPKRPRIGLRRFDSPPPKDGRSLVIVGGKLVEIAGPKTRQ